MKTFPPATRKAIRLLSALLLAGLAASPLAAQTAARKELPPPTAPFVRQPPAGTAWSAEIDYGKAFDEQTQTGGAPRPTRLDVANGSNEVQLRTITDNRGQQQKLYVVGGTFFEPPVRGGKVIFWPLSSCDFSDLNNLKTAGFPGLDWLSTETYVGVETREDADCYHFRRPADGLEIPVEANAYIDAATHYPKELRVGEITYTFTPVHPFRQRVDVPASVSQILEKMQQEQRVAEALRRANR